MDYQLLYETGQLTPDQLAAWVNKDPKAAGAAMKARPELQTTLRDYLSSQSTAPSANRPVGAYDQIKDKTDSIIGPEDDDGFLESVGKGIADIGPAAVRGGAYVGDVLTAGGNALMGNKDGLQFDDLANPGDVAMDMISPGLAAVTGGGYTAAKQGAKSLIQQGLKPTAKKVVSKAKNSGTAKAAGKALGGPMRQTGAALGAVGAFDALSNPSEQQGTLDTISAPDVEQTPEAATGQAAAAQTLDSPDGPTPGSGEFNAAQQIQVDPKDKSPGAFQRENLKTDLQAAANRKVRSKIAEDKITDREAAKGRGRERLLQQRYDSTGGRQAGAWDALSDEDKAKARSNYQANSYYNSSDDARREQLQNMADRGGSFVNPNDPENKNQEPGQVSREQFTKDTGLSQDGTGIMTNPDGSFSTLETGGAFDKAGGRRFAEPLLNDVQNAAMGRQLDGERNVFTAEDGYQTPMSEDTFRMSGNMQDYGNAGFQNRDDAVNYLNRMSNTTEPVPQPETVFNEEEAGEEEGFDWTDYAKGAGLLAGGALAARTKPGRAMIKKGIDMFRGPKPVAYPAGRAKVFDDAVARNARAGTAMKGGGLGQPGSMQKAPYSGGTPADVGRQPAVNPWSTARNANPAPAPVKNPYASTAGMKPEYRGGTPNLSQPAAQNPYASTAGMKPEYRGGIPKVSQPAAQNPYASTAGFKPRTRTPEDVGFEQAVAGMPRKDLISAAGGPRVGGKMATDEELRRRIIANRNIF